MESQYTSSWITFKVQWCRRSQWNTTWSRKIRPKLVQNPSRSCNQTVFSGQAVKQGQRPNARRYRMWTQGHQSSGFRKRRNFRKTPRTEQTTPALCSMSVRRDCRRYRKLSRQHTAAKDCRGVRGLNTWSGPCDRQENSVYTWKSGHAVPRHTRGTARPCILIDFQGCDWNARTYERTYTEVGKLPFDDIVAACGWMA